MSDLFKLPGALPRLPRALPVFLSRPPEADVGREESELLFRRRVMALAERLRVAGKAADDGDEVVVSDDRASLRVYRASASWWWEDRSASLTVAPERGEALPTDDEATALAARYLEGVGGLPAGAALVSVGRPVLTTLNEREAHEREVRVVVSYGFEVEGLPVFGPGAKIRVTLADRGRVVDALQFWRTPRAIRELELRSVEEVMDEWRGGAAFASLDARTCSVAVSEVSLGYYAAPPFHLQSLLVPVYEIKGVVSTPELPSYAFAHYVSAPRASAGELKELGRARR